MAATRNADPLAQLVEVTVPAPVGYWPQTTAAYVALALVAVAIAIVLWRYLAHRRATRYRRVAIGELDRMINAPEFWQGAMAQLIDLNRLLRRTALAAYPRPDVASLHGPEWLRFLDRSCAGADFEHGPGQIFATAPYERPEAEDGGGRADSDELAALTRTWIRRHRV